MKILILLSLFLIFGTTKLFGQVNPNKTYINGYYKSNGNYIEGHYRTNPNNTINDNYSTYPNYNPYTGQQGTVQPTYSTPSYSYPTNRTPKYNNFYYNPYK